MTSNEVEELDRKLEGLRPVIRRASRSVAFQWPGVVEADDVEQSIMLRLWESPGSIEKIREMEDRPRYRAIIGIGHQLASEERSSYDYFKGAYRYSVDEVKKALNRGVLVEPPEVFDELTLDLEDAIDVLIEKTPQYVDAIRRRYRDHETPQCKSEENALGRGLTSLVDLMNKTSKRRYGQRDDGLGTRRIVSGSEALDISGSQWDGEDD